MTKIFKTDILIRDKRLKYMQDKGIKVNYFILDKKEYINELKNKLIEESTELSQAKNFEDMKEELADLYEVFIHLLNELGLDINEIKEIAIDKTNTIGGFSQRIKSNYLEIDENNEAIKYYLDRPDKYPEIV